VIIGSVGYDIYIVGKNNKIIFAPGGFAWHCANGVFSIGTEARVIANITKGFNRKLLTRFRNSNVKIVLNNSPDIYENSYIFDFSIPKYTSGISYSEGAPGSLFSFFLNKYNKKRQVIHVGTTNPTTILERLLDIKSKVGSKVKFSSNIYFPYINKSNLSPIRRIIQTCSILFMNYDELSKLKKFGLLSLLKSKLVFVTCGKTGIAVFRSGRLVSSLLTTPEKEVSAIGAGDVFIGACLGSLVKGYDLFTSLALANKAASSSVTSYGTSHIKKVKNIKAYQTGVISRSEKAFKDCKIEGFQKVRNKKA
jgi:sugar/nucleoside kinase (ribokinase family)